MQAPQTRHSLILRLRDPRDAAAWEEFVRLYGDLIRRVAVKAGVDADEAGDIAQDTLLAVSRAIDRFEPRDGEFAFRGWLAKIARNQTLQCLRRRRRGQIVLPARGGTGDEPSTGPAGTPTAAGLEPSGPDPLEQLFEAEHRRQLFHVAAGKVRERTGHTNWLAFWKTAVLGLDAADVAQQLHIRPAQVYVARSRILAAIRREVELLSETV